MIYQPCHYCGSKGKNQYKVAWGDGEEFSSISYRGIDRVYPKRGYTVSNTVPACWVCNNAKQQLTPAKFTAWIKRVARHLG